MDSLIQLQTVMFFSFLIFLYYLLLLWRSRNTKLNISHRRVAPEATGAWPIMGHLPLLGGNSIPHITLGALADKYGPAFTIRLGMQRALVVSSWEVAKECFSTNDRALATQSKAIATKLMGYNYALFGFTYYGTYWSKVRKIAMLELLSNRRLEMLKNVRASEIQAFIKDLYKMWTENKSNSICQGGQNAVLVDMKKWFTDLTLNIIVRMVAGKRYFGTENTASDAEEVRMCQEGVRDFFHYMGLFVVSDAFPFLEGLDLQGYEKAMKRTAKNLDSIIEGWLKEHQQKSSSPPDYNKIKCDQDFMDVMITNMEDSKLSDYDADTVIKATCLNMILGGNDTTVVTFTWVLSLLLNNHHVLKRAQDELDKHVGRDRQVDESDIVKLEYLQAIVKETLRLYPAAPLSAPHEAMEECTIAGYHVPVGTRIVTNLYMIHRDPRVWSDPSEFRPERFLTSHVDMDVRGQHFEFIPFGSGRRMCPGISFALQVLHLGLHLLHGFKFATPTDEPVDMTESPGLTNIKATPLQVLLTPRLPSDFYE